jgi:hypothetical protein
MKNTGLEIYTRDDFLAGLIEEFEIGTPKRSSTVSPDSPLSPAALSEYNPLNLSEVRRRDAQIAAEQIEKWHPLALAGDIDASKELRNWQQRRATLLGLDAPKTTITYLHEDSDLSTISTAELKRLLATTMGAQIIEGELVADPTKAMLDNDDA